MLISAQRPVSRKFGLELQVFLRRTVGRQSEGNLVAGNIPSGTKTGTATAMRIVGQLDADKFPTEAAWDKAAPIHFCHDWQGKNADAQRESEVRLVWTTELLFVRFVARYRSITTFEDSEPNGRRDHLWERDVAEVFLQPNAESSRCYTEFEVSPNGQWIDLEISPGEKRNARSGLRRRCSIYEERKIWKAELALPVKSLTDKLKPPNAWRVNFFRIEGDREPRFYSAWQPTRTAVPNFHVPECFGKLVFED